MSVMTKPLAAVGSGIDAVTEHLDPAVLEKLDPRPLVDLVDKVDPRAVVQKLDPRPTAKAKKHRSRGPLFLLAAVALGGVAFWFLRNRRSPVPGASDSAARARHGRARRGPVGRRLSGAPLRVGSVAARCSQGGPSWVGGAVGAPVNLPACDSER